MYKSAILSFIAAVVLTLAASCWGQAPTTNGSQPHFQGQAPGEKQTILQQIEGTVTAIDSKGMTLTIKSTEAQRAFKVASKTKFTRNAAPASMDDLSVGKRVKVIVKRVYGQPDELASVDIQSQ